MRNMLLLAILAAAPAFAQAPPGHHLPPGPERAVRAREIDIQRVTADLRFDMEREAIAGSLTLAFTPLRVGLQTLSLDAADLTIESVTDAASGERLSFTLEGRSIRIRLGRAYGPGDALAVRVRYSSRPTVGMYFFPASEKGSAQAWNYGEGGLHYGWLPLYNDTNDRFAVEFTVTVPPPYVAVANGTLRETRENPDGTRTFHWVQEEAIPNYLLTVDVGEFAEVSLPEARVGSRSIPLSVWTPPGTEEAVAWTFRDTPQMVEYFSERFGYPYPWPKYDQITLREFGGAMETTTMVGFTETYQRQEGDPPDSGPAFDLAYPTWAYEDTIAHELAHHWFGDLVTCRSLASIWLNESFATFAHTLWNGHAHGQDDLTYQRWRYRNTYLDFVRKTGTVRPLEYFRYPASEKMYTQEITYVKGSLVLHMLRHFLGDENFFRALKHYLAKNAFGEVESADLQRAFEEATGKNLAWFFDDWVAGGGGRPALEVSASWSRERGALDLRVKQVQADLPFENHFRLPLDIEIITAGGRATHTVWLEGWTTQVSLPAPAEPAAVIIDQGNWLVAELRYERPLREVLYQLGHGDLAARLQAARQLATDFPRRAEALEALTRVLADASAHWGLRLEAAVDLGAMGGRTAVAALMAALDDPDRRVRRAAALALGESGDLSAAAALRQTIENDQAEDVTAVAARSLGRLHAPGARGFLLQQLERDSRWWNSIRLGALLGLDELEDASLAPTFRAYTDARYQRQVRVAALAAWFHAAPGDQGLATRLRELVDDRNRNLRGKALELLGKLHRADDAAFLEDFAAREPDPNLALAAREALDEIQAFAGRQGETH